MSQRTIGGFPGHGGRLNWDAFWSGNKDERIDGLSHIEAFEGPCARTSAGATKFGGEPVVPPRMR